MVFSLLGALATFGIGNMTQVNTIASSINNAIDAFGGNTTAHTLVIMGQEVPFSSIVIGAVIAVVVALVLFGGIKRIGAVAEKLVFFMAVVFILCSLSVVFTNLGSLGKIFMMIFKGALNGFVAVPNLIALLGLSGVVIKLTKEHFAKDKLSA